MSKSAQRGARDQRNATTRAAETDRIELAQLLTDAAAQGKLQMSDYEDRLTKAYAAQTYEELDGLRSDLVGSSVSPRHGGPAKPAPSMLLLAIMSAFERRGRWNVPKKLTTFALWGGGVIDLRYADFTSTEVDIHATSIMGGADHPAAARGQRRDQGPRRDGRLRASRRGRGHTGCADRADPRLLTVGRRRHQAEEPQDPKLTALPPSRDRR